jgi:nucleoside-diphosphate-sugar epimerase
MKVIVTGGKGYLGAHVRSFFDADDFSRRSNLNILNSLDTGILADYDVVIHLAAHLDKNPLAADSSFKTNSEGTANVVRSMQPGSVLIYASTRDVYGLHAEDWDEVPESCSTEFDQQSPLEWSKLIGERYVEYYSAQRDIRSCIFRMSTIYARDSEENEPGFVTHYVESVKRDRPIRLPGGGEPVRDILHVDDFSRACRAFIDSSQIRGLYNIGGGRENATSLRGIVDRVGEMIDKLPVINETETLPMPRPRNYISDLTKISRELAWRPTIGIDEGLRSLL